MSAWLYTEVAKTFNIKYHSNMFLDQNMPEYIFMRYKIVFKKRDW